MHGVYDMDIVDEADVDLVLPLSTARGRGRILAADARIFSEDTKSLPEGRLLNSWWSLQDLNL